MAKKLQRRKAYKPPKPNAGSIYSRRNKRQIVEAHEGRRISGIDDNALPEVSYKIVASDTNNVSIASRTENKPRLNLPFQSIITILLVCIVTPLIAGGSIGFAATMGGEEVLQRAPDDVNGFSWAAGSQGDCITTTISNVPTTSSQVSSTVSTIGAHNYSALNAQYLNGSVTRSVDYCGGVDAANDFRLILPANMFLRNVSHSRFLFEMIGNVDCSGCVTNVMDNGFTFDWSVFVNGTEVFGDTDNFEEGYTEHSASALRSFWNLNYTLTVVDYNELTNAIYDCETSCSYVLHFDNVVEGTGNGTDYSDAPWQQSSHSYRVETYGLEDYTADTVLFWTPAVLGIIYGLVALASTPFWNPVWKTASSGVSKMKKSGGLY